MYVCTYVKQRTLYMIWYDSYDMHLENKRSSLGVFMVGKKCLELLKGCDNWIRLMLCYNLEAIQVNNHNVYIVLICVLCV